MSSAKPPPRNPRPPRAGTTPPGAKRAASPPRSAAPAPSPAPQTGPMTEDDIDALQGLLDKVPQPLEPLDVSMLDGFLCGLLVQPVRVPAQPLAAAHHRRRWPALPPRFDAMRLHELALRRHAELNACDRAASGSIPGCSSSTKTTSLEVDAVYPWVAGFATAMELFPELMQRDAQAAHRTAGPAVPAPEPGRPGRRRRIARRDRDAGTARGPERSGGRPGARHAAAGRHLGRPQPASNAAPRARRPAPGAGETYSRKRVNQRCACSAQPGRHAGEAVAAHGTRLNTLRSAAPASAARWSRR
jgi:hypothetical protein